MKKKLLINGQEIEVQISSKTNNAISFIRNDKEFTYTLLTNDHGKLILADQAGKVSTVYFAGQNLFDSKAGQFKIETIKKASPEDSVSKLNTLISPLPGKVIKVCLAKGAKVKEGDEIFRIEAMKMEHRICAQVSGTLKAVNVKEGDVVQDGLVLGEIEP